MVVYRDNRGLRRKSDLSGVAGREKNRCGCSSVEQDWQEIARAGDRRFGSRLLGAESNGCGERKSRSLCSRIRLVESAGEQQQESVPRMYVVTVAFSPLVPPT